MKTSSAKSKGRRLLQRAKEMILEFCPDERADEIVITPSGVNGRDINFYGRAKDRFNWCIEGKNQEISGTLFAWYEQACRHLDKSRSEVAMVIFSKNHEDPMVMLSFEDFLKLTT